MSADFGTSLGAVGLIIGFPLLLLGVMWVLGWLEEWMLQPYERAAAIEALLERENEADEVEAAVTRLVASVADPHGQRPDDRPLQDRPLSESAG